MTTTLITGANKGLGHETARRLVAAGHTVHLGSRDAERGRRAADRIGARAVLIDVTDDASVAAAAKEIAELGGLDVLINNAGIAGPFKPASEFTAEDVRLVHDTNVLGVVRTTQAFLPLLLRSDCPVVVNVGSGLGSLHRTTDPAAMEYGFPGLAYQSSKAAVSMLTVQYARLYPTVRVNCVDPGFTATDLNGHRGTQSVNEGAEVIVAMAGTGADGPTGGFFDAAGPVPW
jgi:NAD(P)-dependent dehydrogenase (short-subunit alcohol dehydrogenase family)